MKNVSNYDKNGDWGLGPIPNPQEIYFLFSQRILYSINN